MNQKVSFDTLLAEVSKEYCKQIAEEFLALDTTGFEITPSARRRFYKMRRELAREKHKKPKMSFTKILLTACIIALSVAISACVAIPEVRDAIKRIVLSWNEEYVEIAFVEENGGESFTEATGSKAVTENGEVSESTTSTSSATEDTTSKPQTTPIVKPTSIEKKAYASYLPDGYTSEVDIDTEMFYSISYFYNNEFKFALSQLMITGELTWADSEQHDIKYVSVSGFNAILFKHKSEENLYFIVWQDNEYEYQIEGYFSDEDELIKIAEGIRLQ